MPSYLTRQRKCLLRFLSQHADESLSVKEIASALSEDHISASAVYRNLAALESEGLVRRAAKRGSRRGYFQYVDTEPGQLRLHLACKKCGKTFPMTPEHSDALIVQIADQELFSVDRTDTVLYGLCKNCKGRKT